MKTPNKNTILNIQKALIGLSALSTVFTVALAEIGHCKKNDRLFVAGTLGSFFTCTGLGMTVSGYLSNPYRQKERE